MEWKKVENRYYKVEEDVIKKATYDEESDIYIPCGEFYVEDFLEHNIVYDNNTEENYEEIVELIE